MARTKPQFRAEFKREAAPLAQGPGVSKTQVAKEPGIELDEPPRQHGGSSKA